MPLGAPLMAQTAFVIKKWAPSAPKVRPRIEKLAKNDTKEPPDCEKDLQKPNFLKLGKVFAQGVSDFEHLSSVEFDQFFKVWVSRNQRYMSHVAATLLHMLSTVFSSPHTSPIAADRRSQHIENHVRCQIIHQHSLHTLSAMLI